MLQIGIGIKTTFRWFGYREISKNVGKPHVSHKITKKKTKHVEVKIN